MTEIPNNPEENNLEKPDLQGKTSGASIVLSQEPKSIYDLTDQGLDKSSLKSKICKALEEQNQSSQVFDVIIKDFNTLYKKYISLSSGKYISLSTISQNTNNDEENFSKMNRNDLEKNCNKLKQELLKTNRSNEEATKNLNENLKFILELKTKMEKTEKEMLGLKTENSSLKTQLIALDKRRRELTTINQKQEEELNELRKSKQELQIKHKSLVEQSGKLIMENEILRNKLLELQENTMNKMNNYNELMESARLKKQAADMYFKEQSDNFKEANKDNKLGEQFSNMEELKVPNKLKYKQKAHNRGITSVTFNNFGSSYITTGADYIIRVHDAAKNTETNVFSGFASAVSEACFDHTEQFLFAGSLDKTAKLWALKNNKLVNTFTGHIDYINCVKSLNAQQHGLTGSSDRTIREWDYNTKSLVRKFNCISACHALGIAPDDSFILSGHMDGSIKLWASNDKPEKVFDIHEDKVLKIEMLKNENQFISLGKDETIKLFDLRKEQAIYTINENKIPQHCESSIAVSSDKKYFAVGSTKGTIYIVNLATGNIDSTINNKSNLSISGLCWRPFNSQIYVGDSGGYLTIWGTK